MKITKTKEELLGMLELEYGGFRDELANIVMPPQEHPTHTLDERLYNRDYTHICPRCGCNVSDHKSKIDSKICPKPFLSSTLEEWFFKLRDESDEDALAVGMHKLCLALARNSKDKYKPNYDYEIFGLYHATPQQLIIACLLALKEVGNE